MVAETMPRDEMWDEDQQQPAVRRKTSHLRLHRPQMLAGQHVARKYHRAAVRQAEYRRLKAIVPSVAEKKSVSKLMVIEEAIRYIDRLHEMLDRKLQHSPPSHQPHSQQDSPFDLCRLAPICCQAGRCFVHRTLFPVTVGTGSDVTRTTPTSDNRPKTALNCSSRVSVIRV